MILATAAPKPRYPKFLFVPYAYAVMLTALAVVQLMGLGGFDFAFIAYETPGLPVLIITVAMLEIFALPFLLRLHLSWLARFLSAAFTVLAPLFLCANWFYLTAQGVVVAGALEAAAGVCLIILGIASFVILNGASALHADVSDK